MGLGRGGNHKSARPCVFSLRGAAATLQCSTDSKSLVHVPPCHGPQAVGWLAWSIFMTVPMMLRTSEVRVEIPTPAVTGRCHAEQ